MKSDWEILQEKLTERFGTPMDFDAILFTIGLQELNKPFKKYKKDEKLDVMHVAICTLLEPFGFYEYKGIDDDGWPHWELKENLPHLEAKQQNKLIIDSIIDYFKKNNFI
ncbi:MAG: hypothetical protein ACK5QC_04895 [Bacteroidota bacterium]|jgi:hypothetical protein|nr:hypothetical protein [Bacteroidota bacterium]MCA6442464.1 hypothetical protein [Bacteroidota bacterium]